MKKGRKQIRFSSRILTANKIDLLNKAKKQRHQETDDEDCIGQYPHHQQACNVFFWGEGEDEIFKSVVSCFQEMIWRVDYSIFLARLETTGQHNPCISLRLGQRVFAIH